MLDENFLKNLKHQCTRDLYWLLASHYQLNPNVAHFRLFPEEILLEMVEVHKTFLVELDDYPREFENYLTEKPTRRLGIYAERLMAYFFKHSPYINLITHSFQVIRSGETLGEIDFIIEWKGELYHIELAVKYYLGIDDLSEFKNWIGPSGNDNLALKLNKALNHQLMLAKENEIIKLVNGRSISSYLFLKGKFYANVSHEELPIWMNMQASHGNYVRLCDAQEIFDMSVKSHLLRPNWMSDLIGVQQKNQHAIELKYLEEQIMQYGGVHLLQKETPTSTNFIVLDSWPEVT